MEVGSVESAAGVCGTLSFVFLATSMGTDYWYIIEVDPAMNMSELNSHSGLWSTHEGGKSHASVLLLVCFSFLFFCFLIMEILTVGSRGEDAHRLHRLLLNGQFQLLRG